MKRAHRKQLIKTYGHMYSFNNMGAAKNCCAYCGDVQEELDHCPPISIMDFLGVQLVKDMEIELNLIPTCKLCNQNLGNLKLGSYKERLLFLYDNLLSSYEKKPHWGSDELEELGPTLKQMISARQANIYKDYTIRLRGMEDSINRLKMD